MKYLTSILTCTLLMLLACVVYNIDIAPVYDSPLVGVVLSAVLWGLVNGLGTLILIIPFVAIGAFVGLLLGEDQEFVLAGVGVGVVVAIPFLYAASTWGLANLHRWVWFFPKFTGWQAFSILMVSLFLTTVYKNHTKKKDEK